MYHELYMFLLFSLSALIGLFSFPMLMILMLLVTGIIFYVKIPAVCREAVCKVLPSDMKVIAHRGAGNDAPENTLAAFRLAKKNGATAVEFDIDFTAEGVAVVIHDATLMRTTNGVGRVNDVTYDYIKSLSASCNFVEKEKFSQERVPSLDDAIKTCLELNMKMFFDMKTNPTKSTEVLTKLFRTYPQLYDNAIVCSFLPSLIYKLRCADPRIVTALTYRQHLYSRSSACGPLKYPDSFINNIFTAALDLIYEYVMMNILWFICQPSAMLFHISYLSPSVVHYFRERNISVIAWTVNDSAEQHYCCHVLNIPYITDSMKKQQPTS